LLTLVLLDTREAEIRRIMVQSQSRETVSRKTYLENTQHRKRADGLA
jgi:hypothetical protein